MCEKSLKKRGECNLLEINLNMYHATAIAAIVLLLGRFIVSKVPLLRNYCIPAPVVGGIV